MPDLVLRIAGVDHTNWTNLQITRSLDQIADTFDLGLTTQASSRPPPVPIVMGLPCEVLYNGALLLSGYIDRVASKYDARSTSLTISGRSRAGQLVDCTAIHAPFRDATVLRIAQDLCAPFGISVDLDVADIELPKETRFKLTEGEKVFGALERLGKDYALRLVSEPDGSIKFTRTGAVRYPDVVIERGRNVLAGGLETSLEERFSQYIFKAQLAASDDTYGAQVNTQYAVDDAGVPLYRPLVIESDEQVRDFKGKFTKDKVKTPLQLRAEWERNTRAGKSRTLTYEVGDPNDLALSWEHGRGVWAPNTIVTVRDDYHKIDGPYLITQVTLMRDGQGTRTSLALTHPEAYEVELPPKKGKKGGFVW